MGAAGNLRHNAAVQRMQVNLAEHHIGYDCPAILNDGGGSLVTGGFQRENPHGILSADFPQLRRHSFLIGHIRYLGSYRAEVSA